MKSIKEQLSEEFEEKFKYSWNYELHKNDLKAFLSQAIDRVLEEEQNRIYAYVEERLLGSDNELLKDLSNIIFNKTN